MLEPQSQLIRLARNESAIPIPAAWMETAAESLRSVMRYPDPECSVLRRAIADALGLDENLIYCGAGIFECLQTLALAMLDSKDSVVIPQHAFFFFRHISELARAQVRLAPEQNLTVDIESILDAVDGSTRLVMLANPGNPTGTYIPKRLIVELRSRLASSVLLVVDEAYADFVRDEQYQPLFDVAGRGVLVLRTFSKLYGLAGCRVGWCYGPADVITALRRIQVPVIVNSVAQAIACSAVRDREFANFCRQSMFAGRQRFIERIRPLQRVHPVESETNFVLLETSSESESEDLDEFLLERGIVLNRKLLAGLDHCIRATIGTESQMEFVASAITEWSSTVG